MNKRTVPPVGSLDAKYILVGEAPGDVEAVRQQPFVGPAGKLLDSCLIKAGIPRTECYILNTVREQPEKSISSFISFNNPKSSRYRQYGEVWVTEAYLEYERQLIRDINSCQANVVVPMGKVATFATTGYIDGSKRRGSILTDDRIPGKKIIPTIHPAAALRQYLFLYSIMFDLSRVKEEALDCRLELPDRTLRIHPTFEECIWYLRECRNFDSVGFDIETKRTRVDGKFTDWEISCFSLAFNPFEAISIPFIHMQDGYVASYFSPDQELQIWDALRGLLEDKGIRKIIQNSMFDAPFMLKKHHIEVWPIDDTLIAQALLTPDLPRDLGFLTSIHTKEPYYKDDGKQYIKFGGDLNSFWLYSAKDAAVLPEIFASQRRGLEKLGNWEAYLNIVRTLHPLLFIGQHGMKIDLALKNLNSQALGRQIQEKEEQFKRLCGEDINPRSPDQLKNYFYIKRGLTPYKKGGKVTTDEDAIKRIAAKGYKEAWLLLDIRKLGKLKGTYMDMTLDPDGRMRSTLNPVTDTGRLSSKKNIFGTGGNQQNLTKEFKQCIIADEGCFIVDMDLSQAENRIVANIAPEPKMIEAFDKGLDVHSLTGGLISGLSPEEVARQNEEKIKCNLGNGEKTWRYWGKQANHSLNYDVGSRTFALYQEISEREARWIIEKYHSAYPGVRQYHSWVQNLLKNSRILTNVTGRRRKFLDRWGESLFKQAYAHIPQSTVADIINWRGLCPIYEDQDTYGRICLLNQVHDSIVFQISFEDQNWEAIAATLLSLKTSLEAPLKWNVREFVIPVECAIGPNCKDLVKVSLSGGVSEIGTRIRDALKEGGVLK